MIFPDRPTMVLGCKVYGFDNWDDAYRAMDEFTGYVGNHEEFEKWLHYLTIEFEVLESKCSS